MPPRSFLRVSGKDYHVISFFEQEPAQGGANHAGSTGYQYRTHNDCTNVINFEAPGMAIVDCGLRIERSEIPPCGIPD